MSGDVGLTEALADPFDRLAVPSWVREALTAEIAVIVAERVREAEQCGAVQALRDAADDPLIDPWIARRLRARADRLAGDQ